MSVHLCGGGVWEDMRDMQLDVPWACGGRVDGCADGRASGR